MGGKGQRVRVKRVRESVRARRKGRAGHWVCTGRTGGRMAG